MHDGRLRQSTQYRPITNDCPWNMSDHEGSLDELTSDWLCSSNLSPLDNLKVEVNPSHPPMPQRGRRQIMSVLEELHSHRRLPLPVVLHETLRLRLTYHACDPSFFQASQPLHRKSYSDQLTATQLQSR